MYASQSSPRRSRAITIGENLVTLALVLVAIFAVVVVISIAVGIARGGESLLSGHRLSVPVELSSGSIGDLPQGVTAPNWIPIRVDVTNPTTRQMLLSSMIEVGQVVIVLAVLWLLRGLATSVGDGEPFGAANVRRLRRLGYLFVLAVPAVELINTSLRHQLWASLPPHPEVDIGVAGFEIPGAALLAGLAAFILAEVFAHGARLREDVEATI